jgi:galactosylxylosylprotein 3-beta-galactosyltransferase
MPRIHPLPLALHSTLLLLAFVGGRYYAPGELPSATSTPPATTSARSLWPSPSRSPSPSPLPSPSPSLPWPVRSGLASTGETGVGAEDTLLCVAVVSGPAAEKTADRNRVRQSWMRWAARGGALDDGGGVDGVARTVVARFFVGTGNLSSAEVDRLRAESAQNGGDLVLIEEHVETLRTLATKVLLSLLWYHNHAQCRLVLKCDDDTLVFLPEFVAVARQVDRARRESGRPVYWGYFIGSGIVQASGPYGEPNYHVCQSYIPYAAGGGYVVSREAIAFLNESRHMLSRFSAEDVSMGTWLAPINVTRIHDMRFDTECVFLRVSVFLCDGVRLCVCVYLCL